MKQTSNLIIRPGNADSTDYDIFAALINSVEGATDTANTLRDFEKNLIEGDILERYAVCLNDEVVGYGLLFHGATARENVFDFNIIIEAQQRGKGYGTQVYDFLSNRAAALGSVGLSSSCQDDDPVSLNFLQSRGFSIRRHIWESKLDLAQFDLSNWTEVLDHVRDQGIRFSSLAAEGNTQEALRKLFKLNAITAEDNPSFDGTYKQTFENWVAKIANAHWFRRDGQLLAIDGEQYVGLVAIGFEEDGITSHNAYTGVDSAYRGRKIALALKVLGAQFAKDQGTTTLVTTNDSKNEPMLAINRKLGYHRTTGRYWLTQLA